MNFIHASKQVITKNRWDPAIPGTFGTSHVGTFSSTAYVMVTSDDTNVCASPGRVDIGSCSWRVINPNLATTQTTTAWNPDWAAMLENVAAGWFGLGTFS